MATDLRDNKTYRLFQKFSQEAKAVSIATVSLIVSTLALLMAWMAVYDAIQAKVRLESMQTDVNAKLSLINDAADVQFKMMMQNRVKIEALEDE